MIFLYTYHRITSKQMVLLMVRDVHCLQSPEMLMVRCYPCGRAGTLSIYEYRLPYPPNWNTRATGTDAIAAGISKAVVPRHSRVDFFRVDLDPFLKNRIINNLIARHLVKGKRNLIRVTTIVTIKHVVEIFKLSTKFWYHR